MCEWVSTHEYILYSYCVFILKCECTRTSDVCLCTHTYNYSDIYCYMWHMTIHMYMYSETWVSKSIGGQHCCFTQSGFSLIPTSGNKVLKLHIKRLYWFHGHCQKTCFSFSCAYVRFSVSRDIKYCNGWFLMAYWFQTLAKKQSLV